MHSFEARWLEALTFRSDQVRSLTRLGERRGRQQLFSQQVPQALESLRQIALVESSESSNRLEGITAPKKRVRELVLDASTPRTRSEQEIAGYRDALQLIHQHHEHLPFDQTTVLKLHSTVLRYLPLGGGHFKSRDNDIIERNPDGTFSRVRFRPVSAFETPTAMQALVDRYRAAVDDGGHEPLVLVPLAVFDLLCVHPFADGNGRVARLVTILLLYHFGFIVGRFVSLERIVEESKLTYYDVLERSSKGWHDGAHDPHPWLDYFWGTLLRASAEFEDRVETVRPGRGSKSDLIRDAINRRVGPFAISDIESDCPGISRELVRRVLRQLRDEGAIAVDGVGRGARWHRGNAERR